MASVKYAASSDKSHFSAPGKTITFSFVLPSLLDSSLQEFNVPVEVTFKGHTVAESVGLFFFSAGDGGLFDISFVAGTHV